MSDPRDYGDPRPSDLDDQPPGDPTAGYSEVDYDIRSIGGHGHSAPIPSDIAPDPGVEPAVPPSVRTWFALILEPIYSSDEAFLPDAPADQYWVLRQDGKRVAAYNVTEESISEYYKTGDDVLIRKDNNGPHDDESVTGWIISGKEQPRESAFCDVILSSDTNCYGRPFTIPFDHVHELLPPDQEATFGTDQDVRLKKPGVIEVSAFDEAVFHIEFSVTINCCNPTASLDKLLFEDGCWVNTQMSDVGTISAPKLWFNRENGFKVLWDRRDCTANVSIGSYARDSILNQQYPEPAGAAFWTDSPRFGGSVRIGTNRGTAYAKIGNDYQYAWLTHGGGKIKFRFPRSAPVATPQFLVAASTSGECVQTAWMGFGGTGKIKALSCVIGYEYCYVSSKLFQEDGVTGLAMEDDEGALAQENYEYCAIPTFECNEWQFCNGLLVSGPDIDDNPFDSPCNFYGKQWPAVCPEDQPINDDPCTVYHYQTKGSP